MKTPKRNNNHFSASDWCEYSQACFKEDARIVSKNSTTVIEFKE